MENIDVVEGRAPPWRAEIGNHMKSMARTQ
jgi:hypothetical protein